MAKSRLHLVTKKMFKVPVDFKYEGSDAMGLKLTHQIKQTIKSSSSLRLTYDNEFKLEVKLIVHKINPFNITFWNLIYSFYFPFFDFSNFYYSEIGYCRKDSFDKSIESIMAKLHLIANWLYREGVFDRYSHKRRLHLCRD